MRTLEAALPPSTDRKDAFGPALDAVPTPLMLVDPELRLRRWNEALSALVAVPLADGDDLFERLAPAAADAIRAALAAAEGDAFEVAGVGFRNSGCSLVATWIPLEREGGPGGWAVHLAPEGGERVARPETLKEKLNALLTVSHAVVNTLDLGVVLTTIAQQVRKVIQVDECTVFLLDESGQVLAPAASEITSFKEEVMACRLRVGEGITGNVALTGRGEIVNDALADPRSVQVPGTPVERSALLCVPLFVRDRVAGVVTMVRIGDRIFQDEDLELATLFAGYCGAALANARHYEEMRIAYEELRATQAQLVQSAKLNALGEMAGGVAHDFNNILAAILGRTQLLMQSVSDPEIRRQLQVVEQAALDGAHAVRRVQEFTRVRQDERFETLDVNRVLEEVAEFTRPAWEAGAKRRGVTITVDLALGARQSVAGNASELREVFTNLVLNAVDAMPWGGAIAMRSADQGDEVRIEIEDTGVGMDPETRARIFDPFFTTKRLKGTGLGLSVAYGIVTRHHGRIDVDSEPCRGTRFVLRFPAGRTGEVEAPPATQGPLTPLRALVVDDEEAVLHVMGDLLRALGQQVRVAHGGPAGLEEFARGTFDVVFTDLGMPDVNGWDVALAVKSRRPETAVVLVTGWGAQLEGSSVQSRGVDHVVPKPFSLEDVERVLRMLDERRGSRAA